MAQSTIRAPASTAAGAAERQSFAERFRQSPIAETLAIPDFRWIWLGSFASFTAMNMQMITRGWLVLRLENDSPSALTWAMVSFAAPMAIISLFGGALSDRMPKKYLIFGSQLGNAALTLVVGMMDATGTIWLGALMALGVLNGSMFALNMPSRQAIISEIVPRDRVMNAVALNNASMNLTRAAGPAVAGILIAFFSTALVFYIVSIVYVISGFSVLRVKSTGVRASGPRKSVTGDIKEGLNYALGDKTLRGLIIMAFLPAMFGFTLFALMPAWAREQLNVTSFDLGYLMAVMGIGALVGTLGLASMRNLGNRGIILLVISVIWGISVVGVAFSAEFVSAIFFLVINGLLSSLYMSLNMTLSQIYADPEKRGRVMSLFMMTFGLMPIGAIPFGEFAEVIGTGQALSISGMILTGLTIIFAFAYPHFRRIQ
ncbi:MAG: MFS transporter [Chloroflexi bacterium]|nr:MFS transporter [Chloroflexota bacterium]